MCGLFGFAGKLGNHEFNALKFSILGVMNDARGGDSAGAFIDGEEAYGIDDQKLFLDFVQKNEFVKNYDGKEVQYALGHCRKASVGAKTIKQAQPVVIRNKETDKVEFVMIHNGTLLNHDELKDKYLKDCPDHYTDSQIFAYIVYFHGFRVLEEYDGAGVFIFVDYRKKVPTMYVFKGGSHQYASSTVITEERPLYMIQRNDAIWFSSLKESLSFITFGEERVIDLLMNTLYIIQDGKIISKRQYDRSARHQLGSVVKPSTYGFNSGYYNHDVGNTKPIRRGTEYGSYCGGKVEKTTHECSGLVTSIADLYGTQTKKLVFKDGLYLFMGEPANGKMTISEYGFANLTATGSSPFFKEFYFYKGFLLKDALSYATVLKMIAIAGDKVEDHMIRKFVMQAWYDPKLEKFYTRKGKAFTGRYDVYFTNSNRSYNILNGRPVSYIDDFSQRGSLVWAKYKPTYPTEESIKNMDAHIIKAAYKVLDSFSVEI